MSFEAAGRPMLRREVAHELRAGGIALAVKAFDAADDVLPSGLFNRLLVLDDVDQGRGEHEAGARQAQRIIITGHRFEFHDLPPVGLALDRFAEPAPESIRGRGGAA